MARIDRTPVPNRDILLDFRGEFGRHCVLVAQAMGHPYQWPRDVVMRASRGELQMTPAAHPLLRSIAAQRERVNVLLGEIKAQRIPWGCIVSAAQQAMSAVEREWEVKIPMVAGEVAV